MGKTEAEQLTVSVCSISSKANNNLMVSLLPAGASQNRNGIMEAGAKSTGIEAEYSVLQTSPQLESK